MTVPAFLAHQEKPSPKISPEVEREIVSRVLYMDEDVLMIDKPSGLAVQGGSKTPLHLDLLAQGTAPPPLPSLLLLPDPACWSQSPSPSSLIALTFGHPEAPRLAHRLDKDTSGILIYGRSRKATSRLSLMFQSRTQIEKEVDIFLPISKLSLKSKKVEPFFGDSIGQF